MSGAEREGEGVASDERARRRIRAGLEARALELESAGERLEADLAFSTFYRAAVEDASAEDLVEALRGQARVRSALARYEEAEELAQLSRTIASLHGQTSAAARAANLCGVIRHSAGDLDAAAPIYREALELAREASDDETLGMVSQNLGVIANAHGDLREARALYLEAICSWVRSAKPQVASFIYNNLGMVCADLEEWMEAEMHFLRGIEIAERAGPALQLAQLRTGRAEPLIHMGEFDAALESLRRAEILAQELDEPRILADIFRFRAMIARLQGDYAAAEPCIARAVAIAEDAAARQELAEAMEETARLRWASQRFGAARVVLREARRVFASLGCEQDVARLDATAAEWAGLVTTPAPD